MVKIIKMAKMIKMVKMIKDDGAPQYKANCQISQIQFSVSANSGMSTEKIQDEFDHLK